MKYKVIGTWAEQRYTTELGEFVTMGAAMHLAKKAYGLHMDLIEIVQVKESTVYSANTENTEELDAALRKEVAGLRREMETLRDEYEKLRGCVVRGGCHYGDYTVSIEPR